MKKGLVVFFKIMVLVLLTTWVIIVCYDFFRVKKEKNPRFCIYETVHKYDDGTTYECVGLGYKVFKYRRVVKHKKTLEKNYFKDFFFLSLFNAFYFLREFFEDNR